MRLDCLASGVSYEAYERGFLRTEDLRKLEEGREEIEALEDRLIVDAPSKRTDRSIMELYSRARSYGADMFVGDQLSWVRSDGKKYKDRSQEMAEVIEEITDMTKEMNVASVWAAQFNRDQAKTPSRKGGRGGLENISLSDVIGQIVDIAFSLGATPDMERQHNRMLDIIKFRRGPMKTWLLDWILQERTSLTVRGEIRKDENGEDSLVNAERKVYD
jgi:replicative DNA helicase